MTTIGVSSVKYTEDENSNKARYDKAKVKRYWSGSRPHWDKLQDHQNKLNTQREDQGLYEDEEPQIVRKNQADQVENAFDQFEPVIIRRKDDARLKRLEQEELERETVQGQRVRQRIRSDSQFQNQNEGSDQLDLKEDKTEDLQSNREAIKQRVLMQERLKEQQRQVHRDQREDGEQTESEKSQSSDEESSYDDEESNYEYEENDNFESRIKPVFRTKEERQTLPEQTTKQDIDDEEEDPKVVEQRKKEQSAAILRQLQIQESEAARIESENNKKEDMNDVITDNDNDEEQELEAWKQRELSRIKLERIDVNKDTKDKDDPQESVKIPKQKWQFLQKYYHKGAFFQNSTDDIRGTTKRDEVYNRDYSAPTGEDAMDKSKLPQVMQVRNFGRSGRTKWTHLVNEDTTQWDSPWINRDTYDKMYKRLGGSKNDLEAPQKKLRPNYAYAVR